MMMGNGLSTLLVLYFCKHNRQPENGEMIFQAAYLLQAWCHLMRDWLVTSRRRSIGQPENRNQPCLRWNSRINATSVSTPASGMAL